MHFLVHILLPIIAESGDSPAIVKPAKLGEVPQAPEGWAKFFKDCYAGDVREPSGDYATLEYALHGFLDQIRRWLGKAPLADIISWHAPDYPLAELSADPPDADDRDARNVARWMFDRFMVASVQEWQLPSLHSEWLYIHGRIPAPCSTTSMAERRLSPQEISNEIAQRTSQDWRRGSTREGKSDLASSFISVAADHLRNGRSEFAAAIFEAVLSLSPNDEDARNNYAFCLMPVDPVNAMAELEKLNESAHPTLTTLANRVLALHLLGRDEAALALGKSEEAQNLPSLSGLMWLVDADHALRLSDWVDTRRYLLTLLDHIDKDCKAGVVDAGADGPTGTFLVLSTGRDG